MLMSLTESATISTKANRAYFCLPSATPCPWTCLITAATQSQPSARQTSLLMPQSRGVWGPMRTTLDSMRVRLWQPAKLSTKFFSPTTQMLILIRWDSMFYTRMVPILETLTALLEYRHESSLCVIKTHSGSTVMSPFTLKSTKRLALWVNLLEGSDTMRILSSFFLQFNIVAQYSGACYKAHDIDSSSHSDKTSIVGWILIGMWAKTLYYAVEHLSKETPELSNTFYFPKNSC